MELLLHQPEDLDVLRERVDREASAIQRDRYRVVLLLAEREREGTEVAAIVGRSDRFVDEWVGRYRRGGIEALTPRKQPGKPPRLSPQQEAALKARLEAGPLPEDGVCTLRGKDIVRILEQEFGVKHTLGSIYGVLARIGYSCLSPRPRHEYNDPQAVEAFKERAPFLSRP